MFKIDLPNRIRNFPLSSKRPLVPLFEAISNSIQAIEEAEERRGKIQIVVKRDEQQAPLSQEFLLREPVVGFEIHDNGIGFNSANYTSFTTSDSGHKATIGGKGVGRLSWLKAFEYADVDSCFRDNGQRKRRTFRFCLTADGLTHESLHTTKDTPGTIVKLVNYRSDFKCPTKTETIAFSIIEHFLQFFAHQRCPKMVLVDAAIERPLDLNELFQNEVKLEEKEAVVQVNNEVLSLRHVRLSSKICKRHTCNSAPTKGQSP